MEYQDKITLIKMCERAVLGLIAKEAKKHSLAGAREKRECEEIAKSIRALDGEIHVLEEKKLPVWQRLIPVVSSRAKNEIARELDHLHARRDFLAKQGRFKMDAYKKRVAVFQSYQVPHARLRGEFSTLRKQVLRLEERDFHELKGILDRCKSIGHADFKVVGREVSELIRVAEPKIEAVLSRLKDRMFDTKQAKKPAADNESVYEKQLVQIPRIYLPVPQSLNGMLLDKGVKKDLSVRKGSMLYVEPQEQMDIMKTIQRSLPLAMRQRKTKFDFSPIPTTMQKKNLRNLFNEESWSAMRTNMVSSKGHRCMVCGGQGGQLLSVYKTPERNKRDSVECHEVWSWEVIDQDLGIGIQKLEEFMIVCNDCHMMFHEDVALGKTPEEKQKEVAKFLSQRQQALSGMSAAEIRENFETREAFTPFIEKTENWILDLSYLDSHDYLSSISPVVSEDNRAGIHPSMVAGIEMFSEGGDYYDLKTVDQILDEVRSDLERQNRMRAGL